MAPQSPTSSRMASLRIVHGLLMVSCFTFCLSHQNPKEFALINPEKSSTKETERKETKAEEELDTEVLEVFHPTHEWQALRPGQAVPAGSHVRLNLQTGAREVKLQYEDKFRNSLKGSKKGKRLDINTNTYTSQDLKSALAKFKEGAEMENSKEDKARQAEVTRLFRPIEELKKDFDELNVVIETDMQIMARLINKFNSSSSSLEEKIAALFDLEYYVHQMDNAQDLLSFGGLQVVINGLNSTEPLVKEYAAFVLGAAFSSLISSSDGTCVCLSYEESMESQTSCNVFSIREVIEKPCEFQYHLNVAFQQDSSTLSLFSLYIFFPNGPIYSCVCKSYLTVDDYIVYIYVQLLS
ncbi:Nucleotide exchange factor SIL1 [Tupaia chinensis]|uniref:Nucleotide exchange factor SIL1 n=1 Tax=Tupaia chinensis TaxID=246437 RepID=L9JUK6_TUPCH|nr:Nucleotide exchange factor SIL1 [Tupaia chinensis]